MVSMEKETLLDAVVILMEQEKEEHALAVFKVAIEKSLEHVGVSTSIISQLSFVYPKKENLNELKELASEIRKEFDKSPGKLAYERVLDYLQLISNVTENPSYSYRKLMASILMQKSTRESRTSRKLYDQIAEGKVQISSIEDEYEEKKYYTTSEAAKRLGLSDQTIRRMCERGKFIGASRIGGDGHWRIPEENFITASEQDNKAEMILQQIDKKNAEAGDVDEFDL